MIEGLVKHERWELSRPFVIARRTYHHADVILVTLSDGGSTGRGEASPTAYYGETVDGSLAQAEAMVAQLMAGAEWDDIHDRLPAGAARNAVDCAVWDLRAKRSGRRAWELAGLPQPGPVRTAMTIGIDDPDTMAERAATCGHDLLKLKLGGAGDLARIRAVRGAAPDAEIIVDANEAWDIDTLAMLMPHVLEARVAMIEQPLPAGRDSALATIQRPVPICADEAAHTANDLERLRGHYDVINIKLDKSGGLTEALRILEHAKRYGFQLMIGCMEGTSLAMAPATLLAGLCRFVDLDGPLLIGSDRPFGLSYQGGKVHPPDAALWG